MNRGTILSRSEWIDRHPLSATLGSPRDDLSALQFDFYADAPASEYPTPALEDHELFVHLGGGASFECRVDDCSAMGRLQADAVTIISAGQASHRRWTGKPTFAVLYLSTCFFEEAIGELLREDPRQVQLIDRFATPDPFIAQLAAGLIRSVRVGQPLSSLALDSVTWGLAVHLLQKHSTRHSSMQDQPIAFSWRERVRVADFIDEYLAEDLRITTMSDAVGIEKSRLILDFPATFGRSVDQYLLGVRLSRAQGLLRQTNLPIGYIAREVGFSDARQFSFRFQQAFGMKPITFRHHSKH